MNGKLLKKIIDRDCADEDRMYIIGESTNPDWVRVCAPRSSAEQDFIDFVNSLRRKSDGKEFTRIITRQSEWVEETFVAKEHLVVHCDKKTTHLHVTVA